MVLKKSKDIWQAAFKLMTAGDKVLVLFFLIISVTMLIVLDVYQKPGSFVKIESNGTLIFKIKITENRELNITGPVGNTHISIRDKSVRVIDSDCPEKICVKTGKIRNAGEFIVCVPNKVVVKIQGDRPNHFDVITQ